MHNSRIRRSAGSVPSALLLVAIAVVYALLPLVAHAQDPHIVRTGDTLSAIAEEYGLSVQELVWLNGIDDPDLIFPGEVIALGAADDVSLVSASDDDATVSSDAGASEEQDGLSAADDTLVDDTAYDDRTSDTSTDVPSWVDRYTIREDLVAAAHKWGWDPYLIMALAWQESGWRQDEVSYVGAIGVMQIMPDTAAELDDWLFQRGLDPWNDVWDNIDSGVAFLTCLYQETDDVELAVGAYYQGLGSVLRDGFFPDTRAYVDNILYMRDLFEAGELP
jgi:LysM repeat protein